MTQFTMKPILEEAKALLDREPWLGEDQWEMLQPLLARAGPDADEVIRWVFVEHVGYTAVRKKAGIEFLRRHPDEGWRALESLATSSDPDDRDTALGVLRASGDPRAPALAKPLLRDEYAYLRLDAADFLKAFYPSESIAVLEELLARGDTQIRGEARESLAEIRGGAAEER